MIWQFIVQKYIFHLNQEAWHSLCWWLAPEIVGRINYNGCIWEAEWLDDLKMGVDEVLRDVRWNPRSPGNCIGEEFRSYLILWDARDVSSGPGLAPDFPCDFRAGIQKGLGIYKWVAGSNFSPLRLYLVGFWILHLLTLNQEWTYFLGYREKLRTSVFLHRRNPDTMMTKSNEMPKSVFSDRSGIPPSVRLGITGVSGVGYQLCRRQMWNRCAYTCKQT